MNNPLFRSKLGRWIYLAGWAAITVVHFTVMHFIHGFPLITAFTDALVFNLVFAIMGLGLWFGVVFNEPDRKEPVRILLNHLVMSVFLVGLWKISTGVLLRGFFPDNSYYLSFLRNNDFNRLVIGVIYYLLLSLIYYLVQLNYSLQEKKKQEAKLRELVQEAELKTLKTQLNPHFIFHSLNSISSLTITRPEQAREMIAALSEYLRYTIREKNRQFATLQEELANIELYLKIEKIRFGNKLKVEQQIGDNCMQEQIPMFVLQPLLENAVKFGVYQSMEQVGIRIFASRKDQFLQIEVENDYEPDGDLRKGEGLGLRNIRNRLELIYQKPNLIKVKNNGRSFVVTLKIPIDA